MQPLAHKHPIAPQQFHEPLICDLCLLQGGSTHGMCFSCRLCDIDLCEGCYNQLILCPNNKHNHILYLAKRNYICNICGNSFKNNISMYCSFCDYDVCMNCYISIC